MNRFGRSCALFSAALALCLAVVWSASAAPVRPESQSPEQSQTQEKVQVQQKTHAPEKAHGEKEIPSEELAASVPALKNLHEVVYPMWHDGYANKNYELIKELLPRADTLVAELNEAKLPGILRDRQERWDAEKGRLNEALTGLHAAAETNDQERMLEGAEAFHMAYERLFRTTRPALPALEIFHQELYKLYHYYMPDYDLPRIRASAAALKEKVGALEGAQLPKRVEDKRAQYDASVKELKSDVNELEQTVKTDSKEKINAAVDKMHSAYQKVEKLFD